MKFRVFTNDIGPHQYSAFCQIGAPAGLGQAKDIAKALCAGLPTDGYKLRILVVPNDRKDLWPDATGRISNAARCYIVGAK